MPNPASTRLWIISYDIAHPKRLRRTARACEAVAVRAQESVFELVLESAQRRAIAPQIHCHIRAAEDSIIWHPQCARCQRKTITLGQAAASEARYWIV
jgi:CRISPR-associated protein Cas2